MVFRAQLVAVVPRHCLTSSQQTAGLQADAEIGLSMDSVWCGTDGPASCGSASAQAR